MVYLCGFQVARGKVLLCNLVENQPANMWYLKSETDKRVLYVVPNKDITIGRSPDAQVCNFAIPDDPSISRRHVTLSISDNKLYVEDLGSRYGTFINDGDKLDHNCKVKLSKNDVIKFGKMTSIWNVDEIQFVTCTSTLKGENLQNLRVCLNKLGGVLMNEWDDTCSYLTMPAITLTIKVVLALAQGSNIVTTDFWNKCLEAVENHQPLPEPKNFIPQIVESTLNKENVSFMPNHVRNTLFAGKTVIFFSRRQLEMYKVVLTKCSANALLLSETKISKSAICEDDVIVIQYNPSNSGQETQNQRDQINEIISYMKTKGKRAITDPEIGLAILYCSTSKYCNPSYSFASEMVKQTPGQNSKTTVLAQESQEQTNKLKKENIVINESLSASHDQGNNPKRKHSDEDIETNPNKKIATGSNALNNESGKRKLVDDISNPSKKMAVDIEDDMFNFLNKDSTNSSNNLEKKLNFTKPQKRKAESMNNEDDLFNFVQDQPKVPKHAEVSINKIFDISKDEEPEAEVDDSKPKKLEYNIDKVDISALRGIKLKELLENQSKLNYDVKPVIVKKEDPDELEQKMNDLDLGSTIVTVNLNLIVKKEPTAEVTPIGVQNGQQKNFKKFKKVWPLKTSSSTISKSASIVIPDSSDVGEINSMSY